MCVYCDLYAAEYWEDIEESHLAPSGDAVAVITPQQPVFHRGLSGNTRELPTGTIGDHTGSTGAWSEPQPSGAVHSLHLSTSTTQLQIHSPAPRNRAPSDA